MPASQTEGVENCVTQADRAHGWKPWPKASAKAALCFVLGTVRLKSYPDTKNRRQQPGHKRGRLCRTGRGQASAHAGTLFGALKRDMLCPTGKRQQQRTLIGEFLADADGAIEFINGLQDFQAQVGFD